MSEQRGQVSALDSEGWDEGCTYALVVDDDDLVDSAPLAELVVEVALAGADAESKDPEHVVGRLLRLGASVLLFSRHSGEARVKTDWSLFTGGTGRKCRKGFGSAAGTPMRGRDWIYGRAVRRAPGLVLVTVAVPANLSVSVLRGCSLALGGRSLVRGPWLVVRVSGRVLVAGRRRRHEAHLGVVGRAGGNVVGVRTHGVGGRGRSRAVEGRHSGGNGSSRRGRRPKSASL